MKINTRCNRFVLIVAVLIIISACNIPIAPRDIPALTLQTSEPAPTLESSTSPGPLPSAEPTQKVPCPSGNCANACVGKVSAFLQSSGRPGSPPRSSFARPGSQTNQTVLVTYQIDGDAITSPQLADHLPAALIPFQQDTVDQEKIWKYFVALIPPDQRKELEAYIVFTDGKGGVLASVAQSSNDPAHWALGVDIVDASNPRDLTYTLLHEFGHLLTLNSAQVTTDPNVLANPDNLQIFQKAAAACPQFMVSNGCSQPDSYLNLFFQKFWTKIYSQWEKVNLEKDQNNYLTLLGQFYFTYQSQFVSDYAVTSPEEDIAETWSHFVFGTKPTGRSVADQKTLFFYNFPELVDLRTSIVNGLCNYAETK